MFISINQSPLINSHSSVPTRFLALRFSEKETKTAQDTKAKKVLLGVYQTIISYKHASVFMKPVTDAQATGYSTIIKV